MNKRYYLDTSIWRDYYENRSDNFRPIGEWAFMLMKNIISTNQEVIFSELVIDELQIEYDEIAINDIFKMIRDSGLLIKVETSNEQLIEAKRLGKRLGIPSGDCLHAILARENKATLVTRDRHFEALFEIVEIKKPEELI